MKRLAWSLAGAEVAVFAATVVLGASGAEAFGGSAGPGFANIMILAAPILAFPLFGGLIASRRSSNPIGWLCLAIGGTWFVGLFFIAYAAYGLFAHPGSLPAPDYVGSVTTWITPVGILGTFFLLRFPDGRLVSRRWQSVEWLSAVAIAGLWAVATFTSRTVAWFSGTNNPLLPHGTALKILDALLPLSFLVFFGVAVASVVSLFVRFRRATGHEREALKWIALAGVVFVFVLTVSVLSWQFAGPSRPIVVQLLQDSTGIGLAVMPLAAFFAVLRYRLYDIDRIISRTISYAIITAVGVGVFVLVALVPTVIIGSGKTPDWLIAVATLVLFAIFRPVRRRVQARVERRFNRARYDAERTIDAFASRLRAQVDIDALGHELEDVVSRTMQPAHVSIWIKS